jgi:uroporphyrinogen-III synthase
MKALVTRPREDSDALGAALRARGIEPVIEPMLSIRFAPDAAPVLTGAFDGAQAVLFTSANGVRAFAQATARRDRPAFAVGDATARAARAAGFADVASAGGDAADLARLVTARLKPKDGALVHAAASAVAGDLGRALDEAGFALRRALLYDAVPADRLSVTTASLIAGGAIGLALFFSPRTAATFVRLARQAGLEDRCRSMTVVALSPGIAESCARIWKSFHVAAVPTMSALLDALDDALAPSGQRPLHA